MTTGRAWTGFPKQTYFRHLVLQNLCGAAAKTGSSGSSDAGLSPAWSGTGITASAARRTPVDSGPLLQRHAVGVISHRGGPVAEDSENADVPVQNIQHLHHVPFALYRGIESLVIKAVIPVGQ